MIIYVPEDADLEGLTLEDVLKLAVEEVEIDRQYEDALRWIYGEVDICGYSYDAAHALKEVDPIAYRCGLADYYSEYYQEVDTDDFTPGGGVVNPHP